MLQTCSGTQEFLIPLDEPYWFIKDQPNRAGCHTHPMCLEVTQTCMQTPAPLLTNSVLLGKLLNLSRIQSHDI